MKELSGFVAELAGQPWAMEREALKGFFSKLGALEFSATAQMAADPTATVFAPAKARVARAPVDGVATVPISGTLMKSVPNIMRWLGIEATAYSEISAEILAAAADPAVESIVLQIDSPGGQVAGVMEASAAIAAAAAMKTVSAVIEDIGASAAYWLASQAKGGISASKNTQVGSIGVYQVVQDLSGMAAQMGVKVHVISSGPHKGAGVPGAPITTEQLGGMQAVIDGMAANFVEAVAKGRGVSIETAQKWATGMVWLGIDAKELGLTDSISTVTFGCASADDAGATRIHQFDDGLVFHFYPTKATAAHVESAANTDTPISEETVMADPNKAAADAQAASEKAAQEARADERKRASDIRAAFPKDPEFALAQIDKGATLAEAKIAFSDVLAEKNAKLEAANADLVKAAATRAGKPKGAAPVAEGTDPESEATEADADAFMAAAREYQKAHSTAEKKCSLFDAMIAVKRARPNLYAAHDARESRLAPQIEARRRAIGVGAAPVMVPRTE